MIVSINQPAYLPWLGYFDRIARSDTHVVLDHVQFEKNSMTNRNKIRTAQGRQWLTVPLKTKGRFGNLPIIEVEIDGGTWARKHWTALKTNYARAPFFAQHAKFFEDIYSRQWTKLNDLMETITPYMLEILGIRCPLRRSSKMKPAGDKDVLILNLCRDLGATTYLSGALGRNYLREDLFHEAGIRVEYQDYNHPTYPQVFRDFLPYMSAIDLLFNCGPESLRILKNATS